MNSSNNLIKKSWHFIDKTDTSWSHFGESSLVTEELINLDAISKIKGLLENLAEVANVKSVRAIALRFPNIHWIDFELELHSDTELDYEDWNKVQDLVIDCEWKLRDDSGEKWYFNAEPVSKFATLKEGSRVIDIHEKKRNRSRGVQKTLYMRFHENSMKNVIDLIFLCHLKFAKSLYRFANRFLANLRTIR